MSAKICVLTEEKRDLAQHLCGSHQSGVTIEPAKVHTLPARAVRHGVTAANEARQQTGASVTAS